MVNANLYRSMWLRPDTPVSQTGDCHRAGPFPGARVVTASSRTLQHLGEWKVEIRASTLVELFTQLVRILADAAGPPSEASSAAAWERVELDARDYATLLVDWANEIIGRGEAAVRAYDDVRNLVIKHSLGGLVELTADIRGTPVNEWVSPVKAATYHDAVVSREGSEWHGIVLFDV